MKILSLAEKKNSCDALKVLMFLTFLGVSEGSGCLHTPVPVPICPQSSYQWYIKAKEFCSDHRNYHCLITELGKKDPNYTIECCMKPEKISKGHMPRYNFNKQVLQEIECESDYFMPVSFDSNKYRQNGVEHCNNKKSKCTNMEGLKVCTEGSTTMDGTCYCDYKNMYVPELPLPAGEFCFKEQHNNCHLRQKCEKPDQTKPQELNMMYECVDACPDGQYRPEMALACEDIVQSTTLSVNVTPQAPSQVPVQTLTKVPFSVTTDDMKKTVDSEGSSDKLVVMVAIILVICVPVVIFITYLIGKTVKKKPLVEVDRKLVHAKKGHTCSIDCTVKKDTILYKVTAIEWLKIENEEDAIEEPLTINSSESKYHGSEYPRNPSLFIKNVQEKDKAFYQCKLLYKCRLDTCGKPAKPFEASSTFVYLNVIEDSNKVNISGSGTVIFGDESRVIQFYEPVKNGHSFGKESLQMKPVTSKVKLQNSYEVYHGDTAELIVSTPPGRDISEIKWMKAKSLNSGKTSLIEVKGRYDGSRPDYASLIIKKAKTKDQGFYSCIVKFEGTEEDEISNHLFLLVKERNPKIQNFTYIGEVNEMIVPKDTEINIEAPGDETESTDDENENASNKDSSRGDESGTQHQTDLDDIKLNTERDKSETSQQHSAIRQQQPENNQLKDMEDLARRHNFGVVNVAGDGNCLYHAASEQMGTSLDTIPANERANELRSRLVNFLKQHPTTPQGESYSKWLTTNNETWEHYLDRMSKPGEFGDEIIIRALCHCFALKVCVLSTLNPDQIGTYEPGQGHEGSESHVVYLGHIHSRLHYVRLTPLEGNKVESSAV